MLGICTCRVCARRAVAWASSGRNTQSCRPSSMDAHARSYGMRSRHRNMSCCKNDFFARVSFHGYYGADSAIFRIRRTHVLFLSCSFCQHTQDYKIVCGDLRETTLRNARKYIRPYAPLFWSSIPFSTYCYMRGCKNNAPGLQAVRVGETKRHIHRMFD